MNTLSAPLITLIIPTRERSETLRYTLETALAQESNSYEILVCDNFSQDGTELVVRDFTDSRIKYINSGKRLSMCDNWEYALQFARGSYVIFIGDDDAVMPGGIDRLEALIQERPCDAYMWTTSTYIWPIDDRKAAVDYLAPVQLIHEMDLKKMASFVIAHGGWQYYRIPGVYHAAISRNILDIIRKKTGRVFHTTQPDLFTSMAIPVFAKTCIHTGNAISIQGRSAKSNGGASIARDGSAVLSKFIEEYGSYQIHPTLFSEAPIVANLMLDSILIAMDKFPEFYGEMKFNYEAMWAFMCRLKLVTRWEVLQKRTNIRQCHNFSTIHFLFNLAIHDISTLRRLVLDKLPKKRFEETTPDNILAFSMFFAATTK